MFEAGEVWPSSLATSSGPDSMSSSSKRPAKLVGWSSVCQRSASGSASSAPSASLTIGPWWVIRTSSVTVSVRPLTAISSRTTSSGSHSSSKRYLPSSIRSTKRSWTSPITLVIVQQTSLFWPM